MSTSTPALVLESAPAHKRKSTCVPGLSPEYAELLVLLEDLQVRHRTIAATIALVNQRIGEIDALIESFVHFIKYDYSVL